MSFPVDHDIWSCKPAASTKLPQSIRPHCSSENIMAEVEENRSAATTSSTPNTISRAGSVDRRRSVQSSRSRRQSSDSISEAPQVPSKAFVLAPTEGLVDSARPSPCTSSIAVIPTRPPLRPAISSGTGAQVSYYSMMSTTIEKKSALVSTEEILVPQDRSTSRSLQGLRYYASLAFLSLLNFACDLSTTSLSTALPIVSQDLSLTALQTFWVPGSLLLSASTLQPLFMRLARALGCKVLLLFGIAIYTIGSLLSALAPTLSTFLAGRVIEGAGVGAITVLTELALGQLSPIQGIGEKSRRVWQRSSLNLFWCGIILGPILGGVFAQTVGWRHIFWVQASCSILCLVALPWLLQLPYIDIPRVQDGTRKPDVRGWLLLSAAISMIAVALFWSATTYSCSSSRTWIPLTLGSFCLIMWCSNNMYTIEPILPVSIFRNRSAAVSCFGACAHGCIVISIIYCMPIFFSRSSLQHITTGLTLAPWTVALLVLGLATSAVISTRGYRLVTWIGWALVTMGTGLMLLFDNNVTTTITIPIGITAGAGLGILIPSLPMAIECAASDDDEAIYSAPLYTYCSTLGRCCGVLASGTIFMAGLPAETRSNVMVPTDTLRPAKQKIAALDILSLHHVWIFVCALAGVAFLLSMWFTKDHKPERRLQTSSLPELEG